MIVFFAHRLECIVNVVSGVGTFEVNANKGRPVWGAFKLCGRGARVANRPLKYRIVWYPTLDVEIKE